MKQDKIHRLLDEGATLIINAVGVTFKSDNFPNVNRQENIKLMKEGYDQQDTPIDLIPEPSNEFDNEAILLDYQGYDCGYVPRDSSVGVITSTGKNRRYHVKGVNKILNAYKGGLQAEVSGVYGGYGGKHLGFSVEITAV